MANRINRDILEEFLRNRPEVDRDRIADWYMEDDFAIVVEIDDGSAYLYDSVYQTTRRSSSIDTLFKKPQNEEEWRIGFAKRLHRKMRLAGLTQDELAWEADISTGALANYINGYSTPTVYRLMRMANVLGCSVNDLVYF